MKRVHRNENKTNFRAIKSMLFNCCKLNVIAVIKYPVTTSDINDKRCYTVLLTFYLFTKFTNILALRIIQLPSGELTFKNSSEIALL